LNIWFKVIKTQLSFSEHVLGGYMVDLDPEQEDGEGGEHDERSLYNTPPL